MARRQSSFIWGIKRFSVDKHKTIIVAFTDIS